MSKAERREETGKTGGVYERFGRLERDLARLPLSFEGKLAVVFLDARDAIDFVKAGAGDTSLKAAAMLEQSRAAMSVLMRRTLKMFSGVMLAML